MTGDTGEEAGAESPGRRHADRGDEHHQQDQHDQQDEATDEVEDGEQMDGVGEDGSREAGPADGDRPGDGGATRANGLTAAYYVPLRDVDPRVGVELLGRLGAAGIAAYVAPTPGSKGGYGDVHPPPLPTDRLWVDGARRTQAEAVISGSMTDDEVFEQLVAAFHESPPDHTPWPATEDLSSSRTSSQTRRSITARYEQQAAAALTPSGEPALPEHVEAYLDEHFVPAPPPPLPRPAGVTVLAWVLVALGIVLLVAHNAIPADFSQGSAFLAACAIVGGFVTLVYRLRDRDQDDDDDGAVV